MGALLRKSLLESPVVRFGEYHYFVHPLCDGIPAIEPDLLREVADEMAALVDLRGVDRIVTVEAMGIPLSVALSMRTGVPVSVVRKRRYGLPGEREIGQETGYSKGRIYVNGLEAGHRIVFVDDVISTGGTLRPLLHAFRDAGILVQDIVVAIEKGEGRARIEADFGVRVRTLQRIDVRDGKVVLLG